MNALRWRVLAPALAATVLVVEDDPQLRDLYRQALLTARYRATAVGDGLTALALIDEQVPDVLVLDLGLPRVSGWDVYRDLRARDHTKALPIIVVSGNKLRDISRQDLVSFFTKPIDPTTLVEAVDDALRAR
jgi:DNA-binding response OmpR family regulator